jgi:hypothetical protein
LLLLGAAALEGSAGPCQQQQLQQRLALCRQYQQQYQQVANKLGLSHEVMAAVAAWFSEAEKCTSSSSSSSEGAAAGSDAAADCLSAVCAAALMVTSVSILINPWSREDDRLELSRQLTAVEELAVTDFFVKVWCTRSCFLFLNYLSITTVHYYHYLLLISTSSMLVCCTCRVGSTLYTACVLLYCRLSGFFLQVSHTRLVMLPLLNGSTPCLLALCYAS